MPTQMNIPGYVAGTWAIDSVHSVVSFQVALLGVFRTRGTFDDFEGAIVTTDDPLGSSARAVIRTASVNTKSKRRDADLLKKPFLDAAEFPAITFASTGVRADGDQFLVDGDLTIRATTKPVTLILTPTGFGAEGRPSATFNARTEISCSEFGVTRGPFAPAIGDKVAVSIDIRANRQD
jgi:polyisoprenoid-binding protein YceI